MIRTDALPNDERGHLLLDILEFVYSGYFWFSMFGVSVGIAFPMVGSLWLGSLCLACVIFYRWQGLAARFILLVMAVSGSHIAIQTVIYRQDIFSTYVLSYFWWIAQVIVLTTLMRRPDFFKRLTVQMFFAALIWTPFVVFQNEAGIERVTLQAGNVLDNSNAYAEWLGYCALVFWLWSETHPGVVRKQLLRAGTLLAFLLALRTISRGFILVFTTAFLISLRRANFSRKVKIIFAMGGIFLILLSNSSLYSRIYESYHVRFKRDTARVDVLGISLKAIASKPVTGYGLSQLRKVLPISPHNELILLWITSGIVPAALYVFLLVYAVRLAAIQEKKDPMINPLPLMVFVVMNTALTNIVLPRLWAVCSMSYLFTVVGMRDAALKTGSEPVVSSRGWGERIGKSDRPRPASGKREIP